MATKSERKNQKNTLFPMFLLYHNTKKVVTIAFFANCYFQRLLPAMGAHEKLEQTYPDRN